MEINVTVNAPELSAAINNLANAISGQIVAPQVTAQVAPITPVAPAPQVVPQPTQSAPVQQETATQPTAPTTTPVAPAPQPTAPVAPTPQPQATAETAITLEALCAAGAKLVESGQMAQVIALLGKYGVQAINQLPAEKYTEFATELRAIGGQI